MNLAHYLAHFLRLNGVDRVFGLPGGENVPLMEALRQAGLDYILVHHEASAGYAADVSGQLTGRPGVCLATVGPGAVNLVAGAAAATLERSPMLAITAEVDSRWQGRVQHMQLDLPALFGPATKASYRLEPGSVAETLPRAWRLAQAPPRGAVHLALAPDLAVAAVDGWPSAVPAADSPPPVPEALSRLVARWQRAERPVLLAGLGLEAAGAQAELLALVEAWPTPVAVTPKAKGHFPEDHPLFAGCFTAYGDGPLRRELATADLVVGVGLDSVDFVTSTWESAAPVVNLAPGGAADPALRPVLTVAGDLRAGLRRLARAGTRDDGRDGAQARAAWLRQAIVETLGLEGQATAAGTVALGDLIRALRVALPSEGVVTVDVGAFKLVFLQSWPAGGPGSVLVANGLSAMGYAIPAALAARLARPERPVVAVAGDGALLMYAGELATVARQGEPLVILVVVDQALALIRLKQWRQGVPVYGTEFRPTDYGHLAAAFGLDYRLIDGAAGAEGVLREALALARPVLVEARIDRRAYDRFR